MQHASTKLALNDYLKGRGKLMRTKVRRIVTLLCAATALAAFALPSAAQAANPGEVCSIYSHSGNWGVWNVPIPHSGSTLLYELYGGDVVRIEAYGYEGYTYYGHKESHVNGYFNREAVIQSTCHST
jgi:hypothetical protein